VYTSGFLAEYGNAQSGVINMVPKEGGETWTTRLEAATVLPYYKTWGGSPYDKDNLYFSELLLNTEEWLKEDPTNPGKRSLAHTIRVVSPHKDLGLDIGKIGQAARKRYHLFK
jgi:hypothetical protein